MAEPGFTITIPYPPTVNTYWRHVGSKVLISREGRAYRELVWASFIEQRASKITGDLAANIVLYPPDKRRRDLDNTMKAVLDGLQHAGAYDDDSQFKYLCLYWGEVFPGGKAVVTITKSNR